MVSQIRVVSLRFSVPWFIVLLAWVSPVYTKYVSTAVHSVEFPQKNQFLKKPGFLLSALIILDWYPCFSVPWFIVLSAWVSPVYAKYVSTAIHSVEFPQKSVQKKPRIPTVCVDNFRLG